MENDIVDFRPLVDEGRLTIARCDCEDRVPLDSIIDRSSGVPVIVGLQCAECKAYHSVHNGVVGMGDGEIH